MLPVSTRIEQVCYTEQVHLQAQPSSHQGGPTIATDFGPAGLTASRKVEPGISAASLKRATNGSLDATESLNIEVVSWLDDLADMFIDARANGEGVDSYAVKA